jgi:thiol-disulfide isomerase/thioredoxin
MLAYYLHERRMSFRVTVFLSFVFAILIFTGCARKTEPIVGQPAPDFAFQLSNGTQKHLIDFRGKKILLVFWSTWCEVCKSELPSLSMLNSVLNEKVTILGVIVRDQKKKAVEFLATEKPSFLNGIADTKPIADKYKVLGVPEIFFIDENGLFLPLKDVDGSTSVKLIGGKPWSNPTFYNQLLETTH